MSNLIRLIACGSVDDGKSTLIGRLLYDNASIFEDQIAGLTKASRRFGTQGDGIDFALIGDALEAEREQGITIDVAYRYFSTKRRKFILADAPGHEQYTRNMVTAASTADLAIVLVDARKGILTQTRRHSYLARLLGIRQIALAVNKMDLVGWDRSIFQTVVENYRALAEQLDLEVTPVPICAISGDNLALGSTKSDWYRGPTLLEHLEDVEPEKLRVAEDAFRMPVQWVNRPDESFRGFSGTIATGTVAPGDRISIMPAGTDAEVEQVNVMGGNLDRAVAGQSVTLTFRRPVECARGSVLSSRDDQPCVADQFEAHLHWMADEALLPGRQYLLKLSTQSVLAVVQTPKYEINVDTLEQLAAKTLSLNAIGVVNIWTVRPITFEPYEISRELGGFILIDRISHATVAAGMINFALRRSINVHEQRLAVVKAAPRSSISSRASCGSPVSAARVSRR